LSKKSYHALRLYDDKTDVTIPLAENHEWFAEENTDKGNLYYEEVWLVIDPSTLRGVTRVVQHVAKGLRGQPRPFHFGAKPKQVEPHVCYLEPTHLAFLLGVVHFRAMPPESEGFRIKHVSPR
jgi:hypothetical protein